MSVAGNTRFRRLKLRAVAVALPLLLPPAALAGANEPASGSSAPALTAGQPSVSMTLHHVLSDKSGQQYYTNASKQVFALPGAGVGDGGNVFIYTGSGGQSWYFDKTPTEALHAR